MTTDKQKPVDLDELKTVSIAELACRRNNKTFDGKAPDLFEVWWEKHRNKHTSPKRLARDAWYACAKSLGVYEEPEA